MAACLCRRRAADAYLILRPALVVAPDSLMFNMAQHALHHYNTMACPPVENMAAVVSLAQRADGAGPGSAEAVLCALQELESSNAAMQQPIPDMVEVNGFFCTLQGLIHELVLDDQWEAAAVYSQAAAAFEPCGLYFAAEHQLRYGQEDMYRDPSQQPLAAAAAAGAVSGAAGAGHSADSLGGLPAEVVLLWSQAAARGHVRASQRLQSLGAR